MFPRRAVERTCAWGSALVPAWWAAAHLGASPAANVTGAFPAFPVTADADLLRTVGLVDGGQTRILSSLAAAPFTFVPLGSGFTRASLASIAVTAITARLLYAFARGLVETRQARPTRLAAPAIALAVLTVMLSPPWQDAATRPLGANLTALFALAVPLAMRAALARRRVDGTPAPLWMGAAFVLPTLAIDLGAVLLALAGTSLVLATPRITRAAVAPGARRSSWLSAFALLGVAALATGSLGFAVHVLDRSAIHPLTLAGPAFLPLTNPLPRVLAALGPVVLLLAAIGLVLLLVAPRSRAPGVVTLVLLALSLTELATAAQPTANAALLLVVALLGAAMAPALHLGVELLRWAKDGRGLPRALLLLLAESTLFVSSAADAQTSLDARIPEDGAWSTFALARLPPSALVLVSDRDLYAHLRAAELAGEGRPDVTFVPLFALSSREGSHAWETNPRLLPLFRDFALSGAPGEATLSALASVQPLFVENGLPTPSSLAIHQVPAGIFDRFFPESRGASDRLRALAGEDLPSAEAALGSEGRAVLVAALRRRAFSYGQLGEREVAERALADLDRFAAAAEPAPAPAPVGLPSRK